MRIENHSAADRSDPSLGIVHVAGKCDRRSMPPRTDIAELKVAVVDSVGIYRGLGSCRRSVRDEHIVGRSERHRLAPWYAAKPPATENEFLSIAPEMAAWHHPVGPDLPLVVT